MSTPTLTPPAPPGRSPAPSPTKPQGPPYAADGRFAGGTVAGLDGTYTLNGLPTGNYVIAFIDPTGNHTYEYHHDATSFFDATPVAVTAGNATALDADLTTP